MTDEPDYEVGYGKPPVATRFKAGNKGGGRKKGAKGFAASVKKLLRQRIKITEGGRSRSILMMDAMLLRSRNQAMGGDPRAIATWIALAREYAPGDLPDSFATSETDKDILARYLGKNARTVARQGDPDTSDLEGADDD